MAKRTGWSLIVFLLLLAASVAAQNDQNVVSDTKWYSHPVTGDYISGELDRLAVQYKQYAPIAKMAIYDIGYPKDAKEFHDLNGYALLLVAAVSQTKEELPIKRVYISVEGKEIELERLNVYLFTMLDPSGQTAATLGTFRMDAIFAFPVYLRLQKASAYVEFGKDPKPMALARFDGSVPASLARLPSERPTGAEYPKTALRAFMKREYPGYFQN